MNHIVKVISSRIDHFGVAGIQKGYAVSAKKNNIAVPYNSKNLLGISCQNVLPMNFEIWRCPYYCTNDGSKIEILECGKLIYEIGKGWKLGTALSINNEGKIVKARFHHRVFGEVVSIDNDFAIIYFDRRGI